MSHRHPRVLAGVLPLGVIVLLVVVLGGRSHQPVAQSMPGTLSDQRPGSTISVSVQRVAVDIVVKNSAGNPVTGLAQSDFRVTEDGKLQSIHSFDAYTTEAFAATASTKLPPLPPNTFSNYSIREQSGPLTVLLYDLMNTPLDAQPYARAQMLDFLKKRPRSSPVAIFALTDGLHLVQGFTDEDNTLIAALSRQRQSNSTDLAAPHESAGSLNSARGTGLGQGRIQDQQLGAAQAQQAQQAQKSSGGSQSLSSGQQPATGQGDSEEELAGSLQHTLELQDSAFLDRRVDATAAALQGIARFLTALPGRKNLVWLSGSFPAGVLPATPMGGGVCGASATPFDDVRNYSAKIREVTQTLNESHTAVYPVDARGLMGPPQYSAAIKPVLLTGGTPALLALCAQSQGTNDSVNARTAAAATMEMAAEDTGGHAFYNTNGLAEAAAKAIDDGSTYYALTYQPTNTKTDGKLRRIKVECLKRGYTLEYRRFYFADSGPTNSAPNSEAADPMLVALRRGAPPAHSLFFEAHLQTLGDALPATPQELEELSKFQPPDPSAKHPASPSAAKPTMMQHYAITYGLLTRQLDLGTGSQRHASLEFAAMAYDRDGNLLKGIRTKIDDTITPARYDRLQQNGYQTIQRIGIPANTATLRIGVRDTATKLIGSTEIHLPLATEKAAH